MSSDSLPATLVRRYDRERGTHTHEHAQVLFRVGGTLQLEVAGHAAWVDATCGLVVPAGAIHAYCATSMARVLVIDDLTAENLGDYEITPVGRRMASNILLDLKEKKEVLNNIIILLNSIEPLASYIPDPVLSMLVESAADRRIPPDFPSPTIMFVNFIGLPESADRFSRPYRLYIPMVQLLG